MHQDIQEVDREASVGRDASWPWPLVRLPRLPLWVILVSLVLFFFRFGYGYGAGDQDELIPSVLHLLDPSLFTRDWLIQTVTDGINVRTYFLWLAALPALVLPVWLGVALLWTGVFVGLGYGIFGFVREVTGAPLAAALAVPLVLVGTVKWTLGDNTLVYDALVPEGVAWALAVPALTLFLHRRWVAAGVLLGVAAWFHLLAGAQTALVLGLLLAWRLLRDPVPLVQAQALVYFGTAFLLAALPILVPVAVDQVAGGTAVAGAPSPFYVHAQFRNPHHHLFFAFEPGRHLRFWPLMALGLGAAWWLQRRGALRHGRALARLTTLIVVLCTLAVVFVEVAPVTFVAKLQLFKLTVLLNLFASLCLAGAAVRIVPEAVRRAGAWLLERRWTGLALSLVLVALVLALAVRGVGRPGVQMHPLHHQASTLGEAEAWARAETPVDALFAIPPSVSTFRSYARRAVVIDFTGFVFSDPAMQVWFRRLMDVAPIDPPEIGYGVRPLLDDAYHRQAASDWERLQRRYGIDFVLLERERASLPFPVAFENAEWVVYRLAP